MCLRKNVEKTHTGGQEIGIHKSAFVFFFLPYCTGLNHQYQVYSFFIPNLPTWCEELTPWKRPWCWERMKEGGEGDDRGWDDWMASQTQWTWVWASSRSWWWTGKPHMLQSMGVAKSHKWLSDWTELNPSLLPWVLLGYFFLSLWDIILSYMS